MYYTYFTRTIKKEEPVVCELCGKRINPSVEIFRNDICVCTTCHSHLETIPLQFADCVERFLLGNVV